MKATDIAKLTPDMREVKPGKFEGPCPLHGGKSGRAFVVEQSDDRVLMLCRVGCATADILQAIGLCWNDLFDDTPKPINPAEALRIRATEGLEPWRQFSLTRCCELIRTLERHVDQAIELAKIRRRSGATDIDLEPILETIQFAYFQLSELEHDFNRLNADSRAGHLEVWREHQAQRREAVCASA